MFSLWLTWVFCLWILFVVIARRSHPQLALGVAVPIAWLSPVWLQWTIFQPTSDTIVGTGIDIKLGASIAMLITYCFFKRSTYPWRLVPCDWAMLGLVTVHLISDVHHQGPQWIILGRVYAEWYVAYLAGRLAFQYRIDISRFWPVVVGVAMCLGCVSAFEMGTGISPYEWLAGTIPDEGRPGVATRWGLRRAYGPTLNPIYFGSLQLLLFGWCLYAGIRAITARASWGWLIAPLLSVVGIVASGSRGAHSRCRADDSNITVLSFSTTAVATDHFSRHAERVSLRSARSDY